MEESSESILVQENGIYVANGSMKVTGNLEVGNQLIVDGLKVKGDNYQTVIDTTGTLMSFNKACMFKAPVEFNNGQTIIGIDTTYGDAYVGSPTIQAGKRVVIGDSNMMIDATKRKIVADTYSMTLARLDVDNLVSKKQFAESVDVKKLKVTEELIGQNIFADTITTNKLYLEDISGLNLRAAESMKTKDLIVGGTAKVENDIIIMGRGATNGAALTVNGGQIIANKGIVAHTGNNLFQTLQIFGSGTAHDVCFRISPGVDSMIEGDVTIQGAKLILDNSKLVTDNVTVTPLSEVKSDEPLSGVQLTTATNWEAYEDEMVKEVSAENVPSIEDEYDPVRIVGESMARCEVNYELTHQTVKSLINPITYLMEQNDKSAPKRFSVKNGVYRIDRNGNALFRNVVSETGRFSKLEANRFNVNRLKVDKLVTTSVASNVVHTDNLMKSEGIAEFDGAVNVNADVFIEKDSKVDVASGAKFTFQKNSELFLKDGAKFTLGSDTTMKMSGDVELDLNKVVFLDSTNGRRYKISFRDAHECEGGGVVMDYTRLPDKDEQTSEEIAESTELDARELDAKLRTLGI